MAKLRVGVFMGGKTIEKEVSFNSGRTICDHLDTLRYEIIPLFQTSQGALYILPWHFLHRGKITDFEHRLESEAQHVTWSTLKQHIDFAYIASHGHYVEDGILQGFLEVLRIPYLGSKVFASALGMDKIMQKEFLAQAGIDTARGIVVSSQDIQQFEQKSAEIFERLAQHNVTYPCIVKPSREGSSFGVSVVFAHEQLQQALINASTISPEKLQDVLVEEKVTGMEFTCIILTDYKTGNLIPLPPTEIVHQDGKHINDYEQKYMPGRSTKYTPARTSQENIQKIQQICIRVMHALGFTNLGRFDGMLTEDNRVVIFDPNSLSGMGPSGYIFRQAAQVNMSHTDLINHLIETELHHYGMLDAILAQEKKEAIAMDNKKIRVAVLMGGASNEKEISLESGRNITYKLSPHKYQAIPIFLSSSMELYPLSQPQLVQNSTKIIEQMLDPKDKISWDALPALCDFVFIALHGGEGENGSVQGTLEMLGLPYNGSSVLASALCMDKYKTTQFLAAKGFDVPRSFLVSKTEWNTSKETIIGKILQALPLPLIVKPHDDGCSVMVQKAKTEMDVAQSIESIFAQHKEYALVEECIVGMELTVGVVGNNNPRALPPSQAVSASEILSIEEKFLPGAGENQTPAPLPQETLTMVQKVMADAYKALGCKGYSRIDCFYQTSEQSPTGKERVVILENNSLPGMTPATCIFHQAAEVGIKPMDFVDMLVQFGFEEHGMHQRIETQIKEQPASKNVTMKAQAKNKDLKKQTTIF